MRTKLNHQFIIENENLPCLVFLHGAGGSISTWKYQVEAFKPYFRLLLLDLRDHGLSKNILPACETYSFEVIREDLNYLLEDLKIERTHFVTLSFGSVLVQDFQKHYPQKVGKIILAGGIFDCNWLTKSFVHSARFLNLFLSYKTMYNLFSYLLMPFKRNQLARKMYKKQADKITQEEYLKWIGLYAGFFSLLKDFAQSSVSNSMLIVMGSDDYIFLKSARKFTKNRECVLLKVIPKAGHICNIEASKEFNELSLDFLTNDIALGEKPLTKVPYDTSLLKLDKG